MMELNLMWVAVTRDPEGSKGLLNVLVQNLIFLEFDMVEKWVIAHTLEERFYMAGSLTYWAESLKAAGLDFEKVDRNIVVQVSKIKRLDSIFTHAYFVEKPTAQSKKITMSSNNFKHIMKRAQNFGSSIVVI
jgi:DNA-binding LytR/AlgR family response regulator